jgi:hypothetical protein
MSADPIGFHLQGSTTWKEAAMDQQTIAYGLTWVGTAAWVLCFWWMHRISTRQDALLTELRDLAQTQQDILREVHPDVGEIKEHVVEEQGAQINAIAEQVTQVANTVASPKTNAHTRSMRPPREDGGDIRHPCHF